MISTRRRRLPTTALYMCGLVVLCAIATGCNMTKLMADNMVGSLNDAHTAFNREHSVRQAREAVAASLSMIDGFIVSSPNNVELLLIGAENNTTAAAGLIEFDDERWATELYRKGLGYALRALSELDADMARLVRDGSLAQLNTALAKLEAEDDAVAGLYWTALAWGGLINLNLDDIHVVADLPKVLAIVERLAVVAGDFHFAGPHLFLAVYYGSRGPAVGGDLKQSKVHFEEVFRRTKRRYLIAQVYYAEFYCVSLGSERPALARAEFTHKLEYVLNAPMDILEGQQLTTAIAKQRAEELLPQLDDYIFAPLPPENETGS